ncbi:DUF3578 domain-containing protein [Levilactobacillus brevis]|mgnify:CR=1 FL=1|uniref:MrcB family domain-containing protein n=2 Tax=Levilactobacillus brevis TaxID=1580 RepID=UPI0011206F52|nr:DUF3578 domain-containing protein [Levilactobacillus brevis]TOY84133.1 DUF3578 domain-containing protein [Levilactobacillus brevis]
MDLKQLIEYVMDNYPNRGANEFKDKSFAGNKVVAVLDSGLKGVDNKQLFLTDGFTSKGSAGNGNWATVPWLALFDTKISGSAQKGFYLVYLFSPDLNCVYLSLNQGWSFYRKKYNKKDGLKNIKKVSNYWQNNLENIEYKMSTESIDLQSSKYKGTTLPLGYERGNILSIKYDRGSIPEASQLVLDLIDMKKLLTELEKKLFATNSIDYSISYILKQFNSENQKNVPDSSMQDQMQELLSKVEKISEEESPKTKLQQSEITNISKNNNYSEKDRRNLRLGFIGEKLVLQYEKEKLEQANRIDLSKRVEHVSQTQGDGTGYDIKSYTSEGVPVYIEVKTTRGGRETPFYVSRNEMKVSEKCGDSYRLVRIYDVGGANKFYTVIGNLEENLEVSAQLYKALPKADNN